MALLRQVLHRVRRLPGRHLPLGPECALGAAVEPLVSLLSLVGCLRLRIECQLGSHSICCASIASQHELLASVPDGVVSHWGHTSGLTRTRDGYPRS